jgi:hypothetical protein
MNRTLKVDESRTTVATDFVDFYIARFYTDRVGSCIVVDAAGAFIHDIKPFTILAYVS